MNEVTREDTAALRELGDLLDEEGRLLAAVRIDGQRLEEVTTAKRDVLDGLTKWPTGRYDGNWAVRKELRRLAGLNDRNGRMLSLRMRSNQRLLETVSAVVGSGLYSRLGAARR
ncbi:MAG TPA: hypothetical protein VFQ88_07590 [Nevskiaceae bacterium]|nr:hypothetical protein [Nevskiaceae bacterium]